MAGMVSPTADQPRARHFQPSRSGRSHISLMHVQGSARECGGWVDVLMGVM